MRVKYFTSAVVAVTLSACALSSHAMNANDDNQRHVWMPKQPADTYWQAPKWSSFNSSSTGKMAPPASQTEKPVYKSGPRPLVRQEAPVYKPRQSANYPRPNRPARIERPMGRPDMVPPAPPGPYTPSSGPDKSAPGYPANRNYRRSQNTFWGRSGPRKWMKPNKGNMEQGWDDMVNAPGRMGRMPGGWTAPEVTMPNPVDVGDQVQDNVKELPEQIRDMNVGDEVK